MLHGLLLVRLDGCDTVRHTAHRALARSAELPFPVAVRVTRDLLEKVFTPFSALCNHVLVSPGCESDFVPTHT